MRKILGRSLFAVGGAVAAIAFAASSAFAAGWTVAGSLADGNVNFTGSTTITIHDPSGPQTLTCLTPLLANLPDGTVSGPQVGSIVSISPSGCNLGGFIPLTVALGGLPYAIDADSQSGDNVSGRITGAIALQFGSSVGCSGTISGTTLPMIYQNGAFQLEIPGTGQDLTLSGVNVAGCQNLLHDGDPVSISGTYDVDAPVTINETP